MEIKEGVFSRIGQSVNLLKNNFIGLFLPYFIYSFVNFLIFGLAYKYYLFNALQPLINGDITNVLQILNDSKLNLIFTVFSTFSLVYVILYIPVLIGLIRSFKQAILGEKIAIKSNFIYGINKIFDSFKTYWYIFAYIALVPAIFFIVGGLLIIISGFLGNNLLIDGIGLLMIFISIILFISYGIYRGVKSIFALYSAIDNDSYTKQNFEQSVKDTNNSWARIVGNFIVIGIIFFILNSIKDVFIFVHNSPSTDFNLLNGLEDINKYIIDYLINYVKNMISNFSLTNEFLIGTFNVIYSVILMIFLKIFIYLFYVRLRKESNQKEAINTSDNEKIVEL